MTKFGIGMRVDTQRKAIPGALSVTWLDIDPEYQFTLIDATTNIVMEQLGNEGYLGSCFANIGRRNFTFTAWENVETAKRALRGGAHRAAMRMTSSGELGDNIRVVTSIWRPEALNGIVHAGPGKPYALEELDDQWI